MPKARNASPLAHSVELWDAMTARGGFQLRRKANLPSYDAELSSAIALRLGLRADRTLRSELIRHEVAIECLLEAFLLAAEPWSRMMHQIFDFLARAAAGVDAEAIEIQLHLDRLEQCLADNLRGFMRQSAEADRVIRTSCGPQWGKIGLGLSPDAPPGESHHSIRGGSSPIEEWAATYRASGRRHRGSRPPPPPFSTTGHADLDRELERLRSLLTSFVSAADRLADSYEGRIAWLRRPDLSEAPALQAGWKPQQVASVESDWMPAIVAEQFERLHHRSDFSSIAGQVCSSLKTYLDRAPPGVRVESLVQDVLALLDLPVWRRRHELYSVWISTLIAAELPETRLWQLTDGCLSYAFGGSELVRCPYAGQLWSLWAELRRPLLGRSQGARKHAVQPDYTLLTTADRSSGEAGLVVECKQYRVLNRRNFRAALADYSVSHPKAHVLLANYGPAPSEIATGLRERQDKPVAAFGEVRPFGKGIDAFRQAVRDAVASLKTDAALNWDPDPSTRIDDPHLARAIDHLRELRAASAVPLAEFWVKWTGDADIDLHLKVLTDQGRLEISFRELGSQTTLPWATHSGDVRQGPGHEKINIWRWAPGRYQVLLHRYQGDWGTGISTGVRIGDWERSVNPTLSPDDEWVLVCEFSDDEAKNFRVNLPHQNCL